MSGTLFIYLNGEFKSIRVLTYESCQEPRCSTWGNNVNLV